jgi:hypothetical protein
MSIEELKCVKHFIIENEFGKIIFEREIDLCGLDLDKLISFSKFSF